jgi:hypothetical protein
MSRRSGSAGGVGGNPHPDPALCPRLTPLPSLMQTTPGFDYGGAAVGLRIPSEVSTPRIVSS